MLEIPIKKKSKTKTSASKLPQVKRPPDSVLQAVVKRAKSKSGEAKIMGMEAPAKEAVDPAILQKAESVAKRKETYLAKKRAERKAVGKKPVDPDKKDGYWEDRKESVYLMAARSICSRYLRQDDVVLDVGSHRTPTLEWHREKAKRLVSVDLVQPYRGKGVEAIRGDFFDYPTSPPIDLVTCFQVLEHVPDAGAFARKLLSTCKTLVVSVPYKWAEDRCKHHIHDPVDEDKMMAWFGVAPIESFIARELDRKASERLIQVYLNPAHAAEPAAPARVQAEPTPVQVEQKPAEAQVADKQVSWASQLFGKLRRAR